MPLKKVRFLEVYPAQEQERRMLVDTDQFQPEPTPTPPATSVAWSDLTGVPSTFTPAAHDHPELMAMIWFMT